MTTKELFRLNIETALLLLSDLNDSYLSTTL